MAEVVFLYRIRKGAYVKALGEGLSHPPRRFSVSLADGGSRVLAEPEGVAHEASAWVVRGVSLGASHTAAVAFRVPVKDFRF